MRPKSPVFIVLPLVWMLIKVILVIVIVAYLYSGVKSLLGESFCGPARADPNYPNYYHRWTMKNGEAQLTRPEHGPLWWCVPLAHL